MRNKLYILVLLFCSISTTSFSALDEWRNESLIFKTMRFFGDKNASWEVKKGESN